ncbi:MAG: pantoate--beta-alanine ligase [Phycisphaeraceae bacterium]
MQTITTIDEFRAARGRLAGTVALVPTMGALHEAHLALVARGKAIADHVAVSIFVNPTQFGPREDFNHYPRMLEADLQRCEEAGVELVFAPSVNEMYPPSVVDVQVTVPELTKDLEGAARPGHFAGVCRVCAKLFNIVQPDVAVFGRKDYQQLKVIEALVADLAMPLRIEPVETRREPDGLAMSSRNQYLDKAARRHAVGLYKALQQARELVGDEGEADPEAVERAMREVIEAHHMTVDYAVVRHPETLRPVDAIEPALTGGVVALVAAHLGEVHLIDNMVVGVGD